MLQDDEIRARLEEFKKNDTDESIKLIEIFSELLIDIRSLLIKISSKNN